MQEPVRTAAMQSAVSPPLPAGRIPELDGLRGTAILLVFISHYLGGGGHLQLRPWLRHLFAATNIGWSGVDLFFILSGFLIGGILIDARNSPHYFRAFYMRRVHRILPIYYRCILLYAIIVSIALLGGPNPFSASSRDLLQIPVQFLFLQNLEFTLYPFQHIWFLVTWSLAVEEQFYIFAPPLIRFLSLRKLIYVLGCAIVVAPIFRFVVFRYWFPNTFAPAYLLPCRADALALGVLLAIAWRNSAFRTVLDRQRRSLQLTLLFLFLGACASLPWMVGDMSLLRATVGYSWLAALYACLLLLVLSQTQGWLAAVMRWKPLRSLGAVSYCVYLIHLTILFLAHDLILHSSPQFHNFQGVAVTLLAAAITLAFAALSWRYFEKPLIRRGHTYAYGEKSV